MYAECERGSRCGSTNKGVLLKQHHTFYKKLLVRKFSTGFRRAEVVTIKVREMKTPHKEVQGVILILSLILKSQKLKL